MQSVDPGIGPWRGMPDVRSTINCVEWQSAMSEPSSDTVDRDPRPEHGPKATGKERSSGRLSCRRSPDLPCISVFPPSNAFNFTHQHTVTSRSNLLEPQHLRQASSMLVPWPGLWYGFHSCHSSLPRCPTEGPAHVSDTPSESSLEHDYCTEDWRHWSEDQSVPKGAFTCRRSSWNLERHKAYPLEDGVGWVSNEGLSSLTI